MASKNTNIVSKTLVESYIRKQVKALKQSPAETIDTLTKQLLDKPKGSLEKYLLHITPEKLHWRRPRSSPRQQDQRASQSARRSADYRRR